MSWRFGVEGKVISLASLYFRRGLDGERGMRFVRVGRFRRPRGQGSES